MSEARKRKLEDRLERDPHDALHERQVLALEALLEGATVTEAADRAGVHRVTVQRWKSNSPEFEAALNRARLRAQDQIEDRLLEICQDATEVIHSAIVRDRDPWVALQLLKGMGQLSGNRPAVGSTSADVIRLDRLISAVSKQQFWAELNEAYEAGEEEAHEFITLLADSMEDMILETPSEFSSLELLGRMRERAHALGLLRAGAPEEAGRLEAADEGPPELGPGKDGGPTAEPSDNEDDKEPDKE